MKPILGLKEFLIRRQVLQLYKDILKTINKIEDPMYKTELSLWARNDFKRNKGLKDSTSINIEITRGKKSLNELKVSMNMAQ